MGPPTTHGYPSRTARYAMPSYQYVPGLPSEGYGMYAPRYVRDETSQLQNLDRSSATHTSPDICDSHTLVQHRDYEHQMHGSVAHLPSYSSSDTSGGLYGLQPSSLPRGSFYSEYQMRSDASGQSHYETETRTELPRYILITMHTKIQLKQYSTGLYSTT